ncbi:anthranilate synthase component II [Putridiphycobacter roseus]|uniref:anthranilate synthase component II n=1 Tax=Putridiphycobacter roseus TaxID=2219161 RepID=UPI00131403E8|nr:aminodeoxychorismate/anthranilate synthase component II [Putridiphycobacter roseus]
MSKITFKLKVLLIDNYDSFTYNIVHYLEGVSPNVLVDVFYNDQIPFDKLDQYDKIVLSPGPGLPKDAGDLFKLIQLTVNQKPILGICLGFQALVEFYGGEIYNQDEVKHGIAEYCLFDIESKLFQQTPNRFKVGLYHSWAARKENFPTNLKINATSEKGVIMGFEHMNQAVYGVQFHPESILTENGHQIFKNYLAG